MRYKLRTIAIGVVTVVFVGSMVTSASAGGTGWTSTPQDFVDHPSGAIEHGQTWDSSKSKWKAYTKKSGWTVSVQSRFNAYGTWYYTSKVSNASVATVWALQIQQHESTW